tara:strand:- start:1250 stop:1846 length:597 start_codon:yes stop_codon:yes gene_type:complete
MAETAVSIYDHDLTIKHLFGEPLDLSQYRGKALLVVNVASECGFTPQYKGLQALHQTYSKKGLVVIGVPSNDFGNQEPGTAEEINQVCSSKFGVEFPITEKIRVKGKDKHPLYAFLTQSGTLKQRGEVRWNFTKFLLDGNGQIAHRYTSYQKPLSKRIQRDIDRLLSRLPTPSVSESILKEDYDKINKVRPKKEDSNE